MYSPEIPSPLGPSMFSSGANATWIGTTITATITMNSTSLPGKSMNVKAYAAKAANMIGMIVAGIATMMLLSSAVAHVACSSKTPL